MNLKQFDKIVTDQLSRSELVLMGKGTEYAEEATDETEVDRLAHFKKAAALQDKDYSAKNITYNGQQLTEYEALQQQRYIERGIRRWKREEVAMKAAGQPTDEARAKVRAWQARQRDFIKQTGLKRDSSREQIG